MTFTLRKYRAEDAAALAAVARSAIGAAKFYTDGQKRAWASGFLDTAALDLRLRSTRTLVAEAGDSPVGFCNLEVAFGCTACVSAELDLLYVSPEHQGKGIGRALVAALEEIARQSAVTVIAVYASVDAKTFFEKLGYTEVRENEVERDGVVLKNYLMRKKV
jgi:putative acetyltransferase